MKIYYSLTEEDTGKRKNKVGHQVGYALLSYALQKEYGIDKLPTMEKGKYGKPYFPKHPQIHFNISHCIGMTACILSEWEVGIDVEGRRRVSQSLINKVLAENERKELLGDDDKDFKEDFEMRFLRYWTLKESFIKAIGKGLSYPLCEVEFRLERREDNQIQVFSNQNDWHFFQTVLKDNYLLSVCFDKEEPVENVWDLQEVSYLQLSAMCSNFFNTENTD